MALPYFRGIVLDELATSDVTSTALWMSAIIVALATAWAFVRRPSSTSIHNLPGPGRDHWLLGNEVLATDAVRIQTRNLDRYGATIVVPLQGLRKDVQSGDHAVVSWILKHENLFCKPEGVRFLLSNFLGQGLVVVEPPMHRRLRRSIEPALGWTQMAHSAPLMLDKGYELKAKMARMLDEPPEPGQVAGTRQFDVLKYCSDVSLDILGVAGFGYDLDTLSDRPNPVRDGIAAVNDGCGGLTLLAMLQIFFPLLRVIPCEFVKTNLDCLETSRKLARHLIAVKKQDASVSEDILAYLLRSNLNTDLPPERRLTEEEVVDQIATFVFAGHETTATVLACSLYRLACNPNVQERLRTELLGVANERPDFDTLNKLPYLDAVVRESLRIDPSVTHSVREAKKDIVVPLGTPVRGRDGVTMHEIVVKKGQMITMAHHYINTSKDVWGDDAKEFNPDRFANKALPLSKVGGVWGDLMSFSGGPRNCIGHRFAVTEMKALLFILVRAFAFEQLAGNPEPSRISYVVNRPFVKGQEDKGPQLLLIVRAL